MSAQPGILADIPEHCRYLEFLARSDTDAVVLRDLLSGSSKIGGDLVVAIGSDLAEKFGASITGLHPFPQFPGQVDVPATQADLLVMVRGSDRGVITNTSRDVEKSLGGAFETVRMVDGFKYDIGRDLTGYEDGTENPVGDDAVEAAITRNAGPGLDGGSFVSIQQWRHDFAVFDDMSSAEQDDAIGRHRESNEEFDAPESAHVKRTAQESFDPEAFVVRRSMPWSDSTGSGLVFVAFGNSFDAFEAQMRNMTGANDGIVDGLFQFTTPITGAYYWCPPVIKGGELDLSALD